jgi:propanediol dehydratase small subunit
MFSVTEIISSVIPRTAEATTTISFAAPLLLALTMLARSVNRAAELTAVPPNFITRRMANQKVIRSKAQYLLLVLLLHIMRELTVRCRNDDIPYQLVPF